jgi:hypothetical protein
MSSKLPDAEYLKTILSYEDGVLTWLPRPQSHFKTKATAAMWNGKFSGTRAGRQMPTNPYRQIMVDGVRFLEHRLIAQMFGLDTSNEIDHIDGNGLNNRIENLRPATRAQNMRNTTGWAKKASRVGVHQKPNGRWVAYIRHGGHTHLGTFIEESDAISAREAAERAVYGEYAGAMRGRG